MKQMKLNNQINRNYLTNPRHSHEIDTDYRSDVSFEGTISLTKQSEADACDINNIMNTYTKTGVLPVAEGNPLYGDFYDAPTFTEAMAVVAQANAQFASLPAELRAKFQNDPAQFLAFVDNGENYDELVKMGLVEARPEEPISEKSPQKKAPSKVVQEPKSPEGE